MHKTLKFDVLVIGTGLAGLQYCLKLNQLHPKIRIAILNKTEALECNSRYAQGGIAAVLAPQDTLESHMQDTIKAGDGLCYLPAVESIVNEAPQAIQLLREYKVAFNTSASGVYDLGQEGGHSQRRIVHCGDQTGLSIIECLLARMQAIDQITLFEHHIAVNLITYTQPHDPSMQGEVLGAYILDTNTDHITPCLAHATILATGGAGKTFRYTTNPMIATGDGTAMAYRAGARLGNMEFYQFHPTLLYHPTVNNFLISEAVRGEGALLRNADTQERFMSRYAPDELELATRDVVARAIFTEIERSHQAFVFLDITHKPRSFLKKRFPKIFNTLLSLGIDMSQDSIPVVPAAHYQCGGIVTDLQGRTDLKRLYAIGEVAFTGLHGANRLASNSLLESVVMASRAAQASLKDIHTPWPNHTTIPEWNSPSKINPRRASQINAHWRSLRGEMTSYAGIVRTAAGLEDVLQLIMQRSKIIEEYYWNHQITRDFIELRNIILNAELIVRSALIRKESRGGHFREDYSQKQPNPQESILRPNSFDVPMITRSQL